MCEGMEDPVFKIYRDKLWKHYMEKERAELEKIIGELERIKEHPKMLIDEFQKRRSFVDKYDPNVFYFKYIENFTLARNFHILVCELRNELNKMEGLPTRPINYEKAVPREKICGKRRRFDQRANEKFELMKQDPSICDNSLEKKLYEEAKEESRSLVFLETPTIFEDKEDPIFKIYLDKFLKYDIERERAKFGKKIKDLEELKEYPEKIFENFENVRNYINRYEPNEFKFIHPENFDKAREFHNLVEEIRNKLNEKEEIPICQNNPIFTFDQDKLFEEKLKDRIEVAYTEYRLMKQDKCFHCGSQERKLYEEAKEESIIMKVNLLC